MNLEITGKLLEKFDTQVVSDRFKKREFVLEISDEVNGNVFTNYAKMQLVQNKTEVIDRFEIGDMLRVNFSIKGNRYERDGKVSYFSNLDAWRVEKADANAPQNTGYSNNQGGWNNNQNPAPNNWNNNAAPSNPSYQQSPAPSNTPETADDLPF
ncbi:MAG: DUF3127 domain-containing protein [Bacteroidetes bacterium]|nr:DUF3127 domain-containing protein [Bacteroidota bacterium]MBS1629849.1 DUF3127 domain-containing protein [Bacteroidota bacterium]